MTTQKSRDLESLDDVFLACRAEGHHWIPMYTFIEHDGGAKVFSARRVCKRERDAGVVNPTEKDVLTLATGANRGKRVGSARYYHAPGYLIESGGGTRRDAVVEYLTRISVLRPKKRKGSR